MLFNALLFAVLVSPVSAFSSLLGWGDTSTGIHARSHIFPMPLFMGRAAAVRAATKAKTDAKKTKTNGAFGKRIIVAVRQGGSPDPSSNRILADVIKQAKANAVPMDNINRAIKRASEVNTGDISEMTFEAYGHGGASFIVHVLTDNFNRATSNVKLAIHKLKGKVAEQGSVLFLYDRKCRVQVPATIDEEVLLDTAIVAGIDDFVMEEGDKEDTAHIFVEPNDGNSMLECVRSMGFEEAMMSLKWVSKAPVTNSGEDFEMNMQIVDALEALEDVDSVEHNISN